MLKLILHFEKFYLGEAVIKDRIKQLFVDEVPDMSCYFFIETEEFEKLMQLLSEEETVFDKVIETKLSYEINPPPVFEGLEFSSVINKLGILGT